MKLTRDHLRNMRERWRRDLATLEAAFPGIDMGNANDPESETIRNLATAIAEIDGIITNRIPLNKRALAATNPSTNEKGTEK